jgi:hypothetical protein
MAAVGQLVSGVAQAFALTNDHSVVGEIDSMTMSAPVAFGFVEFGYSRREQAMLRCTKPGRGRVSRTGRFLRIDSVSCDLPAADEHFSSLIFPVNVY